MCLLAQVRRVVCVCWPSGADSHPLLPRVSLMLGLFSPMQAYELGARIMGRFGETTITVGVLMQCDKLVQLLESPLFITTRLHLALPNRPDHSALLHSLYALLAVLPQVRPRVALSG